MAKHLYHYTSGSALLSIIKNSQFWATDISFMNDSQERLHGFEATLEYTKNKMRAATGPMKEFLENFYTILKDTIEPNVLGRDAYVVSFAKEKDSIAHWFSYCEKNQGYCIAFDEASFLNSDKVYIDNYANQFVDVLYSREHLFERLDKHLSHDSLLKYMELGVGVYREEVEPVKSQILEGLYRDEPALKHVETIFNEIIFGCGALKVSGFSHEAERRLIVSGRRGRYDDAYSYRGTSVQFRERDGQLVPYVPVAFNPSSIKEIILGPSGNNKLRREGLEKFLDKCGLECEVTETSTPLRF